MAHGGRFLWLTLVFVFGLTFAGEAFSRPAGATQRAPAQVALVAPGFAQSATLSPTDLVSVVAAGLSNPRGIAFDSDGTLLVAFAGTGCPNAGVARIEKGCPAPVVGGCRPTPSSSAP